jgi:hypothetical protein
MSATATAEKPKAAEAPTQAQTPNFPFRFRLVHGNHSDAKGPGYVPAVGTPGKAGYVPEVHGERRKFWCMDPNANVVETDVDLAAQFGSKFQRLQDNFTPAAAAPPPRGVDLEKLSLAQLLGVAEDEGVDLRGASKKPEVLVAIRSARSAK